MTLFRFALLAFLTLAMQAAPVWSQAAQKQEVRLPYSATEWTTLWMPQEFAVALTPYEFGGFMLTLSVDTLEPVVNPLTRRSYSWGQWRPQVVTVWIYAFDPKAAGTPAARVIAGIREMQREVYREGALACFQLPRDEGRSPSGHCGLHPSNMTYAAFGRCSPTDAGLGNPRCDLRAAFDETFRARFNFSVSDRATIGNKYEALVDLLRSFLVR